MYISGTINVEWEHVGVSLVIDDVLLGSYHICIRGQEMLRQHLLVLLYLREVFLVVPRTQDLAVLAPLC